MRRHDRHAVAADAGDGRGLEQRERPPSNDREGLARAGVVDQRDVGELFERGHGGGVGRHAAELLGGLEEQVCRLWPAARPEEALAQAGETPHELVERGARPRLGIEHWIMCDGLDRTDCGIGAIAAVATATVAVRRRAGEGIAGAAAREREPQPPQAVAPFLIGDDASAPREVVPAGQRGGVGRRLEPRRRGGEVDDGVAAQRSAGDGQQAVEKQTAGARRGAVIGAAGGDRDALAAQDAAQAVAALPVGADHGHLVKGETGPGGLQQLGGDGAPLGDVVGHRDDAHGGGRRVVPFDGGRRGRRFDGGRRRRLFGGERRSEVERELPSRGRAPPVSRRGRCRCSRDGCSPRRGGGFSREPEPLVEGTSRRGVGPDPGVPGQEGGERARGGQGGHQVGLHGRQVVEAVHGDRHAGRERRRSGEGARRKSVQFGVVGQAAALQCGDVVAVQRRQVGSLAAGEGPERLDRHTGLAQVVDGAQQRARQAGRAGHRCEVPGPPRPAGDQAGHEPFAQQWRERAELGRGERVGRELGCETVDRHEPHAGVGSEPPGHGTRQVTAGQIGAGDHHDLAQSIAAFDRGDPGRQGGFELQAIAQDEPAVRVG